MAAAKTVQAIHRAPSSTLTWAVDTNPDTVQRFSERFRIAGTTRLDDVLASRDLDAVFVGVPHFLHADLAIRCAEAGKHIIMEKPLATTTADIDEMIAACRRNGVLLTTNYSRRYRPNVRFARQLVEQGALGRLLGSCIVHGEEKSRRYWLDPATEQTNWRGQWSTSGGGVLINVLVHHLDYFGYITGEQIVRVSCDYDTFASPPGVAVEDAASVQYRYSNGAIGTIVASSHCPGAQEYEVLWGTDGQIRLTRETGEFWSRKTLDGRAAGAWHSFPRLPSIDSRAELIERFARAVFSKSVPDISPEDSRHVTQVVEMAYRRVQESSRGGSQAVELAETT
jgi:predicted dehydrogenase